MHGERVRLVQPVFLAVWDSPKVTIKRPRINSKAFLFALVYMYGNGEQRVVGAYTGPQSGKKIAALSGGFPMPFSHIRI